MVPPDVRFVLPALLVLAVTSGMARPDGAPVAGVPVAEGRTTRAAALADSGIAGHWEAQLNGDTRIWAFTFDFQVKGNTLTGTLEIPALDRTVPVTNGTIKGNTVVFEAFGAWTGTLAGNELRLTREIDDGKKQHMTAHRAARPKGS